MLSFTEVQVTRRQAEDRQQRPLFGLPTIELYLTPLEEESRWSSHHSSTKFSARIPHNAGFSMTSPVVEL